MKTVQVSLAAPFLRDHSGAWNPGVFRFWAKLFLAEEALERQRSKESSGSMSYGNAMDDPTFGYIRGCLSRKGELEML